jgi:hypothetical protein
MSLSDSYRKYGAKEVLFNPTITVEAVKMVMGLLFEKRERPVAAVAVAGMIVWMHSDTAKVSIDETIELMRQFIATLKANEKKMPRA